MAIYSIRDLEKLTGIKAHTIRIWEQRYSLITPARTETNIRYYTDDNLRLLFNIALLNRNGLKISKLAKMKPDDIAAKGAELTQNKSNLGSQIEAITLAMIDLDEEAFDAVLSRYMAANGFEATMVELLYPFLDKLRVLWLTNSINPVHEKFIGLLIRRKLETTIDKLPIVTEKNNVGTVVLYSPEGEPQELALLFMHYLMRARMVKVVYLGSGINLDDVRDACQSLHPDFVLTIIQEPIPRHSIQGYLDSASQLMGESKLLLTGAQLFVNQVKLPANARVLNGLAETLRFFDELLLKNR